MSTVIKKSGKNTEVGEEFDVVIEIIRLELFGDDLPRNLLMFADRSGTNYGSFQPDGWMVKGEKSHVIHINQNHLNRPIEFWMSWVVHHAAHAVQFQKYNDLPKQGYHDKIWAEIMESIGLIPSDEIDKQGNRTGKVIRSHFPVPGGKFDKMVKANSSTLDLKAKVLSETNLDKGNRQDGKVNYYCDCGKPVFGGRSRNLVCIDCNPGLQLLIQNGHLKPMRIGKPEPSI